MFQDDATFFGLEKIVDTVIVNEGIPLIAKRNLFFFFTFFVTMKTMIVPVASHVSWVDYCRIYSTARH